MTAGFTGTREGMTPFQREAFWGWLEQQNDLFLPGGEFHHGACVGADAYAVTAVSVDPNVCIVAHPGDMPGLTDKDAIAASQVVHLSKPNLERNRDIVDAADVLVACPKGPEEQRSGTWSTVRYARKCGKRIVIVWPDGKVTEETP